MRYSGQYLVSSCVVLMNITDITYNISWTIHNVNTTL